MKKKKITKINGWWMDKLVDSVGSFVNLITSDGIERCGRITGLHLRRFTFNGEEIDVPDGMELNGDPNDIIPLDRTTKLDVT